MTTELGSSAIVGVLAISSSTALRDALCAGDVDFVITRDGVGAFAWSYPDAVDTQTFSTPRNFPSGERPEAAITDNRAAVTPKASFVASAVAVLLRQHGRDYFQSDCDDSQCYTLHPVYNTSWNFD